MQNSCQIADVDYELKPNGRNNKSNMLDLSVTSQPAYEHYASTITQTFTSKTCKKQVYDTTELEPANFSTAKIVFKGMNSIWDTIASFKWATLSELNIRAEFFCLCIN